MTSIQIFIFACFCVNSALALGFVFQFINEKKPKSNITPSIFVILFSSAIWSIGMGMMSIQTNDFNAYLWRVFGIAGTFAFMISVQFTVTQFASINIRWSRHANAVSLLGVIVFLLYIQPDQTVFVHNDIGTTFYFKPGAITVVYTIYFTVVSFNIFANTLYMTINDSRKRKRISGRSFLVVELCIFIGSALDLMLPSLGHVALPGSALTHFWGVFLFWFALHRMYKSEITVANMSEYIYDSLDTPVLIFDSNYNSRIMNNAALLFHQLNNTSVDELSISQLYDLDNNIFAFDDSSVTITTKTKNTSTSCELRISKIFDSYKDIIGYIIIVNDLTEHELVISKLQQAKMAADSANMSKSLFLANMSHEIRTPMNAILGFSELALMEDHDAQTMEYFTDIKRSGQTLLTIINQVLDISKIELGSNEVNNANYNTAELFKDLELIIGVQAKKKGLELNVCIDADYPPILYGDLDKLREILINLMNNSVKYSERGSITLQCDIESRDSDVITSRYIISDTGFGIKEDDLPYIFDKFSRVHGNLNNKIEGTGLGLPIVKGLVELMGGTITVESTYGIGTKFTVLIPQKEVSLPQNNEKEKISDSDTSNSINKIDTALNVLVVDDNKTNLKVITLLLNRYGLSPDAVLSGQEALEMCKTKKYDVIMLDQMMPEMDGLETLQKLRLIPGYSKADTVKVVALTANVGRTVEEELLNQGFDAYMSKPIDVSILESFLHTF